MQRQYVYMCVKHEVKITHFPVSYHSVSAYAQQDFSADLRFANTLHCYYEQPCLLCLRLYVYLHVICLNYNMLSIFSPFKGT